MQYLKTLSILGLFCLQCLSLCGNNLPIQSNNTIALIKDTEFKTEFIIWADKEIKALNGIIENSNSHSNFNAKELNSLLNNSYSDFSYIDKVYRSLYNVISPQEMSINSAAKALVEVIKYSKTEVNNNYKIIYKNDKEALKAAKGMDFTRALQSLISPSNYLQSKLNAAKQIQSQEKQNAKSNSHFNEAQKMLDDAKEKYGFNTDLHSYGNGFSEEAEAMSRRMDEDKIKSDEYFAKSKNNTNIYLFNKWLNENINYLDKTRDEYLYVKTKKIKYKKLKKRLDHLYGLKYKFMTPHLMKNLKKKSHKLNHVVEVLKSNMEEMQNWSDERKGQYNGGFNISSALDALIKVK